MTNETDFNPPPNAVPYEDERFAYIGEDSREPDAFFLRDDGGKWHYMDACDFYAVQVWHSYGADIAITEDPSGDTLSARFRDRPDGTCILLSPLVWLGNKPFERRVSGETWFYLGDENGREHRVCEAHYKAVVEWAERGIDMVIVEVGDALTVRDRSNPTERYLVVCAIDEVAA
jgi:hypothetical protein